ncbi:MAG: ribonuclease HII [Balneolaceae bacterium]|nr:ribonuclease HII [Balneolaceae bacterium]
MIDRYHFENKLWADGFIRVMGLDEVGRGCLCGPVVAAGVILKPNSKLNSDIRDSKTLSSHSRRALADEIKESALFYSINECSPTVIDQLNILKASIEAMLRCAESIGAEPDYLLIDGNRFTNTLIPHQCITKGDNRSVSIAAASILAKVYRDDYMAKIHEEYPQYGWDKNVGYPTKKHFEGLEKYGYTQHHRKSFKLRTEKKFVK